MARLKPERYDRRKTLSLTMFWSAVTLLVVGLAGGIALDVLESRMHESIAEVSNLVDDMHDQAASMAGLRPVGQSPMAPMEQWALNVEAVRSVTAKHRNLPIDPMLLTATEQIASGLASNDLQLTESGIQELHLAASKQVRDLRHESDVVRARHMAYRMVLATVCVCFAFFVWFAALCPAIQRLQAAASKLGSRQQDLVQQNHALENLHAQMAEQNELLRQSEQSLIIGAQETQRALLEARLSNERLERLFRLAPVPIGLWSLDGRLIDANQKAAEGLGLTSEMKGLDFLDLFTTAESRDTGVQLLNRMATEPEVHNVEWNWVRPDGDTMSLLVDAFRLPAAPGFESMLVLSAIDITQRVDRESELRAARDLLSRSVEALTEGFVVIDSDGLCAVANPALLRMFEVKKTDILRKPWQKALFNAQDLLDESLSEFDLDRHPISLAIEGRRTVQDVRMALRLDGRLAWIQCSAHPIRSPGAKLPTAYVALFEDVTAELEQRQRIEESILKMNDFAIQLSVSQMELEESNRRLAETAAKDPLTGIANHRTFQHSLSEALAETQNGGSFSLVLIDIDHFKRFNDTHGHLAGDAVLKQVATIIEGCVPEGATAARYGGEEFAVVLPGADRRAAAAVAEKCRSQIASTETTWGQVTASFGVTCWVSGAGKPDVIAAADLALYRSKAQGRNRVSFIRVGTGEMQAA